MNSLLLITIVVALSAILLSIGVAVYLVTTLLSVITKVEMVELGTDDE